MYSKGRSPSVRLYAGNAQGRYINAYMTLHGSCTGITEGVCGNWNGNAGDDLGVVSYTKDIYILFNQKPIHRLAPLIGTGVFVDLYHYC